MAFVSTEYSERSNFESKMYKGSTFGRVIAINPTKAESKELLGYELQDEPVYYTRKTAKNSKGTEVEAENIKIDVFLKPENEKVNKTFKLTFFITNAPAWTLDGTQAKVIDAYGNFSYVNPSEHDFKKPIFKVKKNDDGTYTTLDTINVFPNHRLCRVGEEEFRAFFKAFMQIKNPMNYNRDTKTWTPKEGQELAECDTDFSAEDWKEIFKDFRKTKVYKEIVSRIKQGYNGLNFIVGVKTTPDGKTYNEVMLNVKGSHQKCEWSDYDVNQMLKYSKIDFADTVKVEVNNKKINKTVILPIHEYNMNVTPSTEVEIEEATTAAEATQQLDAESATNDDDLPF